MTRNGSPRHDVFVGAQESSPLVHQAATMIVDQSGEVLGTGLEPLWAAELEPGQIKGKLDLDPEAGHRNGMHLRPIGVSPLTFSIGNYKFHKYSQRVGACPGPGRVSRYATKEGASVSYTWIQDMLSKCLKAKSKATSLQPVLQEGNKGLRVPHNPLGYRDPPPSDRLLTATAIWTVSFPEGNDGGDLRNYLVVATDQGNMGIVHRDRKQQGKEKTNVYGLSVECRTFNFFDIDSRSRVHSSPSCQFDVHYKPGEGFHRSVVERVYPPEYWDRIYAQYWDYEKGRMRSKVTHVEDTIALILEILNRAEKDCALTVPMEQS
ncbi:uncharacterized protein DSM5745_03709 [Aspergillus mulundensis]|uniref:Uncharacterized protein n=1 Tax=Aspergillus mulundensis TaxID=1810919 RepID=A0A3D8SL66_9EURO|nr:hypothetical protein DSM5745_03709 [Aspergillus mulundensis]RDW87067.1 hypothetical protein DSM5745_03709 [Aspergillus mulundensis]